MRRIRRGMSPLFSDKGPFHPLVLSAGFGLKGAFHSLVVVVVLLSGFGVALYRAAIFGSWSLVLLLPAGTVIVELPNTAALLP